MKFSFYLPIPFVCLLQTICWILMNSLASPKCTAIPSPHVTSIKNATNLELLFHQKAQIAMWPPKGDNIVNTLTSSGKAGPKWT